MRRVLAIAAYQQKFNAAFPASRPANSAFSTPRTRSPRSRRRRSQSLIAPFDRYLARDDNALSTDAKRGALLFFGKARCSSCHNGALLGAQSFANAGVPQLGPGTGARRRSTWAATICSAE